MKLFIILFLTTFHLCASQENKIVLATYSTQGTAMKKIDIFRTFYDANLHSELQQYHLEIAVLKSRNYYPIVLKPFKDRATALNVLKTLKHVYPSAFVSLYPNPSNQLIYSKILENLPHKSLPITPEKVVVEKTSEVTKATLIVAQPTILSKSHNIIKPTEHLKSKKIVLKEEPSQSIAPILYFSYFLLTLLIIAVFLLALLNHRLKHRLKDQHTLFNTHENIQKTETSFLHVNHIELSHHIQTALQQAFKEQPALKTLKPIQQIQSCTNDILTINALLHGESYIKNSEFLLSHITADIAKRYNLIFETKYTIPNVLIGSLKEVEHIFSRLSFFKISTITIDIVRQDIESIQLQFILHYNEIENRAIDNELIKQFIMIIEGVPFLKNENSATEYIESFTLPFKLPQDSHYRVKRP